jgi:hypothetical protein
MSELKPIGQVLDSLGVGQDLDDGDLIVSALVLTKIMQADGSITLGIAADESCSWLEQRGLIAAASDIVSQRETERE